MQQAKCQTCVLQCGLEIYKYGLKQNQGIAASFNRATKSHLLSMGQTMAAEYMWVPTFQ